MEEACLRDLAEIDKSAMPEMHKMSKKNKVHRTAAAHRLQRRRLVLDGLYDGDGSLVETVQEAGRLLAEHWAPVFAGGCKDERAQQRFIDKVVRIDPQPHFEWPKGRASEVARRLPDTTPGLDGLSFAFWGCLPAPWSELLDDIAINMVAGVPPPSRVLESFTTNIPKAEHREDTDGLATRKVPELRPLVLMQTGAKLIAYVANDYS